MRKLYLLIVAVLALGVSTAAFAAEGTLATDLDPLNGSEASGTATIEIIDENTVTVAVETSGVSPNLPHAQHIHIGGENTCPPMSADDNGDGLISTPEGMPFYGPIEVSLTTRGPVGPKSALAVDRFPVADASGDISYMRTFDLPEGVTAADLDEGVIVQHGISRLFGDELKYDGEGSPLAPDLPFEATIPALCGDLVMVTDDVQDDQDEAMPKDMPKDMPETGAGGMAGAASPLTGRLTGAGTILAAGWLVLRGRAR